MTTPVRSMRQGLTRATLTVLPVQPTQQAQTFEFCFNPGEYQLQKANNFAEIPIPVLETPPIQFVRGGSEKLSVELLADTSDTLDDVRSVYVDKLRNLLRIDGELHAPPIVRFAWGKQQFKGVVESLNVTYVLFTPAGVPLRAKLSLALKEYRPVDVQVKEIKKSSPDQEKSWVVKRGETLSSIAAANYRDPGQWRTIAKANGIEDPRTLPVGLVLTLPRLV
jgi:hypothetical protein